MANHATIRVRQHGLPRFARNCLLAIGYDVCLVERGAVDLVAARTTARADRPSRNRAFGPPPSWSLPAFLQRLMSCQGLSAARRTSVDKQKLAERAAMTQDAAALHRL